VRITSSYAAGPSSASCLGAFSSINEVYPHALRFHFQGITLRGVTVPVYNIGRPIPGTQSQARCCRGIEPFISFPDYSASC
jgi:hypothetical protein